MKYNIFPQQMQITSGHIKLAIKNNHNPMIVKSSFASRLLLQIKQV